MQQSPCNAAGRRAGLASAASHRCAARRQLPPARCPGAAGLGARPLLAERSRAPGVAARATGPAGLGKGLPDPDDQNMEAIETRARVRSEVLAPFRLVRLVLFGFFGVSASVGLAIALVQLIGALGGGENALPLTDALQTVGIDAAAAGGMTFLFRNDWQARQKQIARLTREERLAALQLELSNKKTVRLGQLRRFARPVLVAGTPQQVEASLAAAEPLREQLQERAIFVVPLPLFEAEGQTAATPELTPEDLKFKGTALRQAFWRSWFDDQLKLAKATPDKGLYVSLRLDGRVRASGMGSPPWERLVQQLPPMKGAWQGILDGMDGRVDAWK